MPDAVAPRCPDTQPPALHLGEAGFFIARPPSAKSSIPRHFFSSFFPAVRSGKMSTPPAAPGVHRPLTAAGVSRKTDTENMPGSGSLASRRQTGATRHLNKH